MPCVSILNPQESLSCKMSPAQADSEPRNPLFRGSPLLWGPGCTLEPQICWPAYSALEDHCCRAQGMEMKWAQRPSLHFEQIGGGGGYGARDRKKVQPETNVTNRHTNTSHSGPQLHNKETAWAARRAWRAGAGGGMESGVELPVRRDTGGREGSSRPGPGSTSEGPAAALSVAHDLFQCIGPTTPGVTLQGTQSRTEAHHAHLCFIG